MARALAQCDGSVGLPGDRDRQIAPVADTECAKLFAPRVSLREGISKEFG